MKRKVSKVVNRVRWKMEAPPEIRNVKLNLNQLSIMNDLDPVRWSRCRELGGSDGDSMSGTLQRIAAKGFAEVSRSGGPKTPNLYRLSKLGAQAKNLVVR